MHYYSIFASGLFEDYDVAYFGVIEHMHIPNSYNIIYL